MPHDKVIMNKKDKELKEIVIYEEIYNNNNQIRYKEVYHYLFIYFFIFYLFFFCFLG